MHLMKTKIFVLSCWISVKHLIACYIGYLLICKLRAYGVSCESCKIIKSYLCNRLQRVKVASTKVNGLFCQKEYHMAQCLGHFYLTFSLTTYFMDSRMYAPFTMSTITQSVALCNLEWRLTPSRKIQVGNIWFSAMELCMYMAYYTVVFLCMP